MAVMAYAWYRAGRCRLGVVISGKLIWCHAFEQANTRVSRSPARDLTARCEGSRGHAALVARHRPRAIVHLTAMTPLGRVPPALACRTAQVNILGPLHAVAAAAALPGG